jgi:hypothetical protein
MHMLIHARTHKQEMYWCYDYDCALKVLPNVPNFVKGTPQIYTSAFTCPVGVPYCTAAEPEPISAGHLDLEVRDGIAWGQFSSLFDPRGRAWFTTQVHKDKVFAFGGNHSGGVVANYARVSSDGKTWVDGVDFSTAMNGSRLMFATASFRGQMFVLGGANRSNTPLQDIRQSADGVTWFTATESAPWAPRYDHAAVSHADRLWIMGGMSDSGRLADVWSSSDGAYWVIATASAAFGAVRAHAAASHQGRMFVYGGEGQGGVWYSYTGITWSASASQAPWAKGRNRRMPHAGLVFDGRLWVIGGYRPEVSANTPSKTDADVWSSFDGAEWTRATARAQFGYRRGAGAVAFQNRMWVLGGEVDTCMNVSQTPPGERPMCGASSMCEGFFISCNGSDVWGDLFSMSSFSELELRPSTVVAGADNDITLVAMLDEPMSAGDTFVISGIKCTAGPEGVIISGRDSNYFTTFGTLDTNEGTVLLTLAQNIPANTRFEIAFTVVNGPLNSDGTASTWREINILARTQNFFRAAGTPMSYYSSNAYADNYTLTVPQEGAKRIEALDGGVMFDIDAQRSVYITGLTVDIFRDASEQPVEQSLSVYYYPGSHTEVMYNLSEWRLLGNVSIPASNATAAYQLKLLDLRPEIRGAGNASLLGELFMSLSLSLSLSVCVFVCVSVFVCIS